jgi:flagellar hook-length control protein FliK
VSSVAEATSQVSSQPARPKAGQGNQSAGGDGFSGLVDSNLSAAGDKEAAPQTDRPRAARDGSTETQAKPKTGVRRQSQDQTEQARQAANEASVNQPRTTEETTEAVTETIGPDVVLTTGIVAASVTTDQIDTTSDDDTDNAQAAAPATPTVTGIVATAVTVQIELAAGTNLDRVIDPSDAITVSNPPATIVAGPAETAANALARVALDTADHPTVPAAETGTQAETNTPAATATTTETPATQANVGATDTASDAPVEAPIAVETAAPEAQIEAKAQAELTATGKADPTKPIDKPQPDQIIASTEAKPGYERDGTRVTPEQTAPAPKPEAPTDRRVEANARTDERPDRPVETETRPAQRTAHEPAATASAHAQTATAEQPQLTGFGFSQTAALHMSNVAVQQLTAMPVQANVPVPVNGLAVEIAANAQIGRSRFEIRLDPPELGRIDVRLDVDKQGQVTSHLIVEKSATLDLLRRDAPQLERALQDAGLKTSDNGLQFSLRDQGQQSARGDDNGSGRNSQRLMIAEEETIVAETAGRSYGRMIGQRTGIDIRV